MAIPFMKQLVWGLALFAALGTGLSAGVFFAFSNFVMKALTALPASKGIAAMQSINITVVNPLFMGILFGTAVACLALLGCALAGLREPGSVYLIAGSVLYLIAVIVTTGAFNVPLNNSLARLDATSIEAPSLWAEYVIRWLTWNHVRTVGSILASAAFITALTRLHIPR